jgi:hypothetical protein
VLNLFNYYQQAIDTILEEIGEEETEVEMKKEIKASNEYDEKITEYQKRELAEKIMKESYSKKMQEQLNSNMKKMKSSIREIDQETEVLNVYEKKVIRYRNKELTKKVIEESYKKRVEKYYEEKKKRKKWKNS